MTNKQFRKLRKKHGYTQLEVSRILRVSTRCIQHWEAGSRRISDSMAELIKFKLGV